MFHSSISVRPRLADLDTQRHVTSRIYESFAWEGRHRLLDEQGYGIPRLLEEGVRLIPRRSVCSFQREQNPGAELAVETEAEAGANGQICWRQRVVESANGGAVACKILTETQSQRSGQAVQLLDPPDPEKQPAAAPDGPAADLAAAAPISPFSGNCRQVAARWIMPYSERTVFYDYPISALWRIAEDGRWHFSTAIGLTEDRIRQLDTITFFIAGAFEFHQAPEAGSELGVRVWLERIEKIRCFMRTDVFDRTGAIVLSCRDEQLIVSLSRRRPRKAPPEFLEMVGAYLEYGVAD